MERDQDNDNDPSGKLETKDVCRTASQALKPLKPFGNGTNFQRVQSFVVLKALDIVVTYGFTVVVGKRGANVHVEGAILLDMVLIS